MAENMPPAAVDPAKIKELSSTWTLAGDAGLLKYMEESAERLMSRVATTDQQLNDSIWEATQATVRFDNVHNQFVALAAKQFFENRVYDEDIPRTAETSSKPTLIKDAKTKAEKDGETLASMREAVSLGCRLVGSHFKRIEIRPQDFDEDDDPTFKPEPLYEPLDPYLVRPLPFLIGSKEFATSKNVGLVEVDQRTTVAQQENEDLVIDVGTRVSNVPSSVVPRPKTEALPALPEKAPSDHSGLYAASSGSGHSDELFGDDHRVPPSTSRNDTDSLFNEPIESIVQPTSSRSIQEELAAKLGLPANIVSGERKSATKTNLPPSSVPKPAVEDSDNDADIFEAPPPLPQTNRTNVPAPSRKVDSLFETRTGGLFDSDEEDDLFAPPKPRAKVADVIESSAKAPPKSSVAEPKPLPAPTQAASKPPPPSTAPSGIFDDSLDDQDDTSDIFAPVSKITQPPAKAAQTSAAAPTTTTVPTTTAPRLSVVPKTTGKSLFDDDSDEDDIFSAAPKKKGEPTKTATKDLFAEPSKSTSKPPPTGGVSVFPSTVDRSPALPAAVKKTDVLVPLADKCDEVKVEVKKTVEAENADRRSTIEAPSASVPVEPAKQPVPSTPSDTLPVSDTKPPSKPVGGVSVLPPLPIASIQKEKAAVINKPEEKPKENGALSPEVFEPPPCPIQQPRSSTPPKENRFALDDNSDDEDLFSPKGSVNTAPPPANSAREKLANVMVAGLKKNLAQATGATSSAKSSSPPPLVDEPQEKAVAESHQPLESLAKTRAKIPSSSRRPPTRRPFSPPEASLLESDSNGDKGQATSAPPSRPLTTTTTSSAAVASPLTIKSSTPAQTPPVSKQQPPSSSVAPSSTQNVKPLTAAASAKSPLFDSDSGDDISKPPPMTSKASPAPVARQEPPPTGAAPSSTQSAKPPVAASTKSSLFDSDSGDDDNTPPPMTSKASPAPVTKQEPPSSSSATPSSAQTPKPLVAASTKSSLFDSDSGDEDSKPPPMTSKTPVASAVESPANKPAPVSAVPPPVQAPAPTVAKESKAPSKPAANTNAKAAAAAALFGSDDDDDDEDIFAPAAKSAPTSTPTSAAAAAKLPVKPATPATAANTSAASGSLFADDDTDDIFATNKPSDSSSKTPVESKKTSLPVKKSAPAAGKGGLFGDDSDSDLDIFK